MASGIDGVNGISGAPNAQTVGSASAGHGDLGVSQGSGPDGTPTKLQSALEAQEQANTGSNPQ